MTAIILSRSAQSQLGQRHHQRLKQQAVESWEVPDWQQPDWKPADRDCLTRETAAIGQQVREIISPYRTGEIVSFTKVFPYDWKLPVAAWVQGYRSAVHPSVLQLIQTETPSSEPEPLPDGLMWKQLDLF